MRFQSTVLPLAALAGSVLAAPTPDTGSLPDGYPSPNPQQLVQIQKLAGGSLPGGALPTNLTANAVATLQLIELNEEFEVAYFGSLLKNITSNVDGYTLKNSRYDRDFIIKTITAIENQEQLHAIGVNAILKSAGATTVAPCQYTFPVNSFESAITLANTFTDVVLGVLPQAQTIFGSDGGQETGLVALLGSVIAQEAEQNGFYRTVQKKIPSAAPFLTKEGPQFAFTFLKAVIQPGCAGVDLVSKSVPTFQPLNVVSKPSGESDQTVQYSVPGKVSADQNEIVYLSGQNTPVSVPIVTCQYDGKMTTFEAELPFAKDGFARGLTIAALVNGANTNFSSIADVAAKTVYGPGIIEIN